MYKAGHQPFGTDRAGADIVSCCKNELKDIRREAVNNVRRTRGKINFDDLITRNFDEGIADDE